MSDQEALRQWSVCILEAALLRCSKQSAVTAEDYDRAHAIKQLESETGIRLTAAKQSFLESSSKSPLAERIQALEKEKRVAVEEEDFDLAHAIKEQLLKLERYTDTEALSAALKLLDDVGADVLLLTCDPSVTKSLAADDPGIWAAAAGELRENLNKCTAQVPCLVADQEHVVSSSLKDITALPVRQLKAELQSRGVEHSHCVEKAELCSLLTACSTSRKGQPDGSEQGPKLAYNVNESGTGVEGAPVKVPLHVASGSESSDESVPEKRAVGQDSGKKWTEHDKKRDKKLRKKEKKRKKKEKKRERREKKRMKKLKHAKKDKRDKKRKKDQHSRKDKVGTRNKRAHIRVSSSSTSRSSSSSSSLKPDEIAAEFSKASAQGDTVRAQTVVISHGIKWRSLSGDGPLHIAARFNQPILVEFLLRQLGACRFLEVRNDVGDTALLIAARLFRGRIALRLVEALADPGAINNSGESPEALDLDGLVRETERDEKCRQAAADERLLGAVSVARKVREDLEWRNRCFEEVADSDYVRFEMHHDLESGDTGSNDWMGDIGRQAAARASAERLAQQAMAAAAAARAREQDRLSKAEAKAERAATATAKPRRKSMETETKPSEPIAQAEDEETRLAARAADEARWQAFHLLAGDSEGPDKPTPLRQVDVPFPSGPSENPLRLDPKAHPAVLRSQLRAGLLRWHPDKFEQRFGRLLSGEGSEQEAVLGRVKAIAQQLNRLMAELLPDSTSKNG